MVATQSVSVPPDGDEWIFKNLPHRFTNARVARRIAAYTGRDSVCLKQMGCSVSVILDELESDSNYLPIRHPYSITPGNLLPNTRQIKRHKMIATQSVSVPPDGDEWIFKNLSIDIRMRG
ncbi:hypothetical protein CEXT_331171 [Caerostris extrusa]|uniref:Uncharacterized protein n=1 Tax=Caerostris extrusa TaxID=172846 RepID=A0AAV4QQI0_CAEEX|nr:hypothetical protein CEXT_331171 [Caerostris extrusa]